MTARLNGTRLAVLAVGAAGLLCTGCSTMNNTERGTLAGAGIGSVAGAIIGNATGNPKTGAVIGGLGGGLVGNLVGQDADRKEERTAAIQQSAAEQAYRDDQPQRVAEIIDLSNSGTDETVILNHLKNNRMTFRLSADDIKQLNANRVSPRVIAAMQNSSGAVVVNPAPRTVVVREPVVVRQPVYVAPPPPPVMIVDPYAPPARLHIHGHFGR